MKTINLLGLEITKEIIKDNHCIVQEFTFIINGVKMRVSTWADRVGKDDVLKRFSGFCETWNHCTYAHIPANLCVKNTEEFHHYEYDMNMFYQRFNNEETYQKVKDGFVVTGVDYQHSWNNAENTDLLTVLAEAIEWGKDIAHTIKLIEAIKNN